MFIDRVADWIASHGELSNSIERAAVRSGRLNVIGNCIMGPYYVSMHDEQHPSFPVVAR